MPRRNGRVSAVCALLFLLVACTAAPSPNGPPSATRTPVSSPGAWKPVAPALVLQQEVAAAATGGRVYVAGGYLPQGTPTDAVESYDPATDSWRPEPDLPVAVHHPAGAAYDDGFVVAGGSDATGASNRVFHLRDGSWRELPPLRHARGGAAAAQVGTLLVVAGGNRPGAGQVAQTEIYDGRAWRDAAPIPTPRDHVSAASDGMLFYAALGRASGRHMTTFDVFDPRANTWTKLPDVPGPARSGGGAAFAGGRVVVAGGEASEAYREVHAWNPATRAWDTLPSMSEPRHGFGLVAAGGTLYALLGGTVPGLAPTRSCESLALF